MCFRGGIPNSVQEAQRSHWRRLWSSTSSSKREPEDEILHITSMIFSSTLSPTKNPLSSLWAFCYWDIFSLFDTDPSWACEESYAYSQASKVSFRSSDCHTCILSLPVRNWCSTWQDLQEAMIHVLPILLLVAFVFLYHLKQCHTVVWLRNISLSPCCPAATPLCSVASFRDLQENWGQLLNKKPIL